MGKRTKEPPAPAPEAPFNNPFVGLAGKLPPPASAAKPPRPPPARAVVRMERSGRGGKTVTVVEKLGLPPRELEAWLKELKQTLGCGGAVEGGALVLQGDLRERTGQALAARGVARITLA